MARVPPEFIRAELGQKINIIEAVAIDIRHCDSIPVIVMSRFPILGRIVHYLVLEGDPASLTLISELKIMESFELRRCLHLLPFACLQQLNGPATRLLGQSSARGEDCCHHSGNEWQQRII